MIIADLVKFVADEIRKVVRTVKFPIEHHAKTDLEFKPITVYEQLLPREAFNDDTYYPFVLVEWLNTSDDLNGSDAKSVSTIGLSMGVFAAESWGFRDALHLTELIRYQLLTRRVVGNKFRLTDAANWEVSNEQPLPFFFTFATLNYQHFLPSLL